MNRDGIFVSVALAICVVCSLWTGWRSHGEFMVADSAMERVVDLENGYQASAAAIIRVNECIRNHIDLDADWKLETDEEEHFMRRRLTDLEAKPGVIILKTGPVSPEPVANPPPYATISTGGGISVTYGSPGVGGE